MNDHLLGGHQITTSLGNQHMMGSNAEVRLTERLETRSWFTAAFAEASRLSTYLSGKVAPSSPLLVRMERVARTCSGSRADEIRKEPGRRLR
jgi:hypothetical protein